MSKKFSIVRTIDFEKLNNEIDEYMSKTGEMNPYIFMHRDTADAITCDVMPSIVLPFVDRKNCIVGEYLGYKVYANNDLKFGEVEIR